MGLTTQIEALRAQAEHQTPIDRMVEWIKEREAIRLKKEAGEPLPWTTNPILASYRFCNVRRMDDKVSRWIMENWYTPFRGHQNMVYAAGLARFFNKPESLAKITAFVFPPSKASVGFPHWEAIIATLRGVKNLGFPVFNGAYMVRGNDGEDKIESVVKGNVQNLFSVIVDTNSMYNTWFQIETCHGFGSFMAGQIVADLRWAMDGTWADKMTWAPRGPGSIKGLNLVMGRPENHPISQTQFCAELQVMIGNLKKVLPESTTGRLEAHDYQNCCCEFSKYERTLWGRGKPKQNYPGRA